MDENMDDVYYPLAVYTSIETFADVNNLDFHTYPNPFSNQLTLEINSDATVNMRIEISNILGQQFYVGELGTISSYQKFELSGNQIDDMPAGVYFLRVYADNMLNKTIKIIKN
jgi:hypothetical protein